MTSPNQNDHNQEIIISHSLLVEIRQWWLLGLDILERLQGLDKRTSDLRKLWKCGIIGAHQEKDSD